MIIRNPYTYYVKHRKLISLILLLPIIYLIFIFGDLATFFKEYVASNYVTPETNLANSYIGILPMIIIPALAIMNFLVWLLLTLKKKKSVYNILTAGYMLILFIAIVFFYTTLLNIEMNNIEQTFANLVRDISKFFVYPLYIIFVAGLLDLIGFNIKTFRFDKHEDLRLTEEDEEDIEVKVNTDDGFAKRRAVHAIRELKYYVLENKAILGIIAIGIFLMIGYKAYLNYQVYNKNYNLNQSFVLDNFALSVKDSYISNIDYKGRIITQDKYYLAVKIGLHNQGSPTKIDKTVFRIYVGDKFLYPVYEKSSRFLDVGMAYTGQELKTDDAQDYVFVYELSEKDLKSNYELRILNDLRVEESNLIASYKKVKLRPEYIADHEQKSPKKMGSTLKFEDTTLKGTTYKLNSLDVVTYYNYEYEICDTPKQCRNVQDTIVPTGGKSLMIVEDEINYDKSTAYYNYELKNFYEDFVTVNYTYEVFSGRDSGDVTQLGNVVDVTPKQLKGKRIYEVPANMRLAHKLDLKITIRNKVYTVKVTSN